MTKSRKRLLLILSLVVIVGAGAGVALSSRPARTLVQTGKVERVALLESLVSASGEIRAKEFVDLQTEIAGVIVDLPVREGDRVQAGDVLLRIDPFQAQQDVASARASFEAARAERTQAESNRDLVKSQLERRRELHAQDLITKDEFEASASALRVAESQVSASDRRCDVAQSNLDRMEDLLGKTTIASPLGGVITKLNVSKGERAVPGILSNPEATLMTIADLSNIEAELKVDETDIIMVSLGDRCIVTVDALPDVELEGRVTEMGNSPIGDTGELMASSSSQEGKDFKVVVRIDDPPPTLRPGLTASAEIYVEQRNDALVIPLQAVTVREVRVDAAGVYLPPDAAELARIEAGEAADEEGGDGGPLASAEAEDELKEELEGVFLREGERVRFRPVELGIKGEAEVEVVAGLAEGDELVTGSYKVLRTLKEWDLIEVEEGAAKLVTRSKGSRRR